MGIKKQLVSEQQYQDAINSMKELKGWEQESKKKEVAALQMCGAVRIHQEQGKYKKALKSYKEALNSKRNRIYLNLDSLLFYVKIDQNINLIHVLGILNKN